MVSWVRVLEWNKTTGSLDAGAEVLVGGEKAGNEEEAGAYWAEVVGRAPYTKEGAGNDGEMGDDDGAEEEEGGDVVYLVRKEPGAEPQRMPRSKPRHRVVEKQCHPGITDDTALPTHSDNAAQHFKSSRNLHFFTKQLFGISGGPGFTSITWDFGAPDHG